MDLGLYLTAAFLLTIAVYSLIEAVRLAWRLRSVRKGVSAATNAVSGGADLDAAFGASALAEQWERYRATFLDSTGEREKTDAHAADYFGEGEVLRRTMSLRYWLSVPNILVGLGILGTFVGLAFGISGFEMDTVESVRESITGLLSGMATAFYTSIAGMLASILFGIYEKARFRKVDGALRVLSDRLDARFHITTADRLRYFRQDQAHLLRSLFGYQTEDGQVRPGDALQAIRTESEQQTVALKQFSLDLAEGIMLSTDTINALGANLGQAFDAAMRTTLSPTLDGVRRAVEQLQEEKASSNEAMVENVVAKLQESLENMGEQFQHALSGGALAQLESVSTTIGETHGALAALPGTVEQLMTEMRSTLTESKSSIAEEVASTSTRLREESERAVTEFGAAIKTLQRQTADLLQRQGTTTESATKLTTAVEDVLKSVGRVSVDLHKASSGLQDTLRKLEGVATTVNGASGTLSQSGQALRETMTSFSTESKGWLQANRENLQTLQGALEESKRVGADYADKFKVIEGGLKGVFHELQEGLGAYQTSTKKQLNEHLEDFTAKLSTAANALSGSVSTLDESLQELVDAVERGGRGNGHATRR